MKSNSETLRCRLHRTLLYPVDPVPIIALLSSSCECSILFTLILARPRSAWCILRPGIRLGPH